MTDLKSDLRPVRAERSGWRDEWMSRRHRDYYGFNCPMVDIDFLVTEYNHGRPVALVEYKHECAAEMYVTHPSFQALVWLADGRKLPSFLVRYGDKGSWFEATPLNEAARRWVPQAQRMSEIEYVNLLYRLRGRQEAPYTVRMLIGGLS